MKICFFILVMISGLSLMSCGKKDAAPAPASTSTGNALPEPSIDCGGEECL